MRPAYLFLWVTLSYVLAFFYRRRKVVNTQKVFFAQTIFVCNHPSSFIDPLIIANYHRPIMHFMTRSDVFKPWLRPVTWAAHMIPIYRTAEDGNDSAEKNQSTFKEAISVLHKKRSLIMFGEGYTDDVFIRSLKPMKKGPARIAFGAMAATNWQDDIKVQTVGVNYSHPRKFNCDLLLSAGKIIHLKDYKKIYDENPNRAATMLTREIEKDLQDQITYVKDKSLAPFVEQIQSITRKGMNHWYRDNRIPLVERFHYSQQTARKVNEEYNAEDPKWIGLKNDLESYFSEEKKNRVDENWVYTYATKGSRNMLMQWLYLVMLFPVFLVGMAHMFLPYIIIKKAVEKMFRRDVFWSGVKLLLGAVLATLYNLPVIWLFHAYVFPSYLLGIAYFLTVPFVSGVIARNYAEKFVDTIRLSKVSNANLQQMADKRKPLADKVAAMGF